MCLKGCSNRRGNIFEHSTGEPSQNTRLPNFRITNENDFHGSMPITAIVVDHVLSGGTLQSLLASQGLEFFFHSSDQLGLICRKQQRTT
jgi:hypothetical protein